MSSADTLTNEKNNKEAMHPLAFQPLRLSDRAGVQAAMWSDHTTQYEYTFCSYYLWRKHYRITVAFVGPCVILGSTDPESAEPVYTFPMGGNDEEKQYAFSLLFTHCREQGTRLILYPVIPETKLLLEAWYPGRFLIEELRDFSGYLYNRETLSALKGRRLSGKRNHIARFLEDPDWNYEFLSEENLEECLQFCSRWARHRYEKWNEEMDLELEVVKEGIRHFRELGLTGGVLRRHGEVIAFTAGEKVREDTMVVHFEKALPKIQGAYPMINRQFVLHNCTDCTYVNREEDTGDEGLRKAKLSYQPLEITPVYMATESEITYASASDIDEILSLWKDCFGDEESYIRFYLKNRFTTDNMLVLRKENKILSMASFLPCEVMLDGTYRSARYVYAVATRSSCRNQGYATRILELAKRLYPEEALILCPETEGLKKFYERSGFSESFREESYQISLREASVSATDRETADLKSSYDPTPVAQKSAPVTDKVPAVPVSVYETASITRSVSPAEYKRLRDAHFAGKGYVRWSEEAISYAIAECEYWGGHAILIDTPGETGHPNLLLYTMEGTTAVITETTMPQVLAASFFAAQKDVTCIEYRNKGGMMFSKDNSLKNGYLNLVLG